MTMFCKISHREKRGEKNFNEKDRSKKLRLNNKLNKEIDDLTAATRVPFLLVWFIREGIDLSWKPTKPDPVSYLVEGEGVTQTFALIHI